jgi:hypothetical protein
MTYLKGIGYFLDKESINAYSYKNPDKAKTVQLIKPFENPRMKTFGQPIEVLDNFDFTLVKFAVWRGGYWISHPMAVNDTLQQHLVIKHINNPIAVAMRVCKYYQKSKEMKIPLASMITLFDEWITYPRQSQIRLRQLANQVGNLDESEFMEMENLLRLADEIEEPEEPEPKGIVL